MLLTPRLLGRNEINVRKWDGAIELSLRPSLYGYADTLDHLTEHWSGLILGDYEAVMPVPWRKKFGIRYAFTPAFVQRLDVYGSGVTAETCHLFIQSLKSAFRYADIDIAFSSGDINPVRRVNYTRDLSPGISVIRERYTSDARRSLKKAVSRNCVYSFDITVSDVLDLYMTAYGKKASYTGADYTRLARFADTCLRDGRILLRAVRHATTGELFFAALFFVSSNRLYYLLGAPSTAGRTARAGYYLIDAVMQEFAGTARVLDFEGSDLPSVAAFYRNFGPEEEVYFHLHHNSLPWIVRQFKK
jgi:hypothetical protein